MKSSFNSAVRSTIRWVKVRAKSNAWIRNLLYDDLNRDQFEGLDYQEVMLADRVRVDSYFEAIKRTVSPGDVVVDLGTGTGLLAMFASQHQPKRVYAIEHNRVIEVAEQVAEANGIACIEFVNKNSRDFDAPEPVDLIIHEQIGNYLFEENMLENVLDLKRRCLAKSGTILPARFELFLEPIAVADEFKVPFSWESPIHGIDYSVTRNASIGDSFRNNGQTSRFLGTGAALGQFACTPEPMLYVDLMAITTADEVPTNLSSTRTVVTAGTVDGLSLYFRVIFDDDLDFDTSLASPNTSWSQPIFRVPGLEVAEGDVLEIGLDMAVIADRRTWTVSLERRP